MKSARILELISSPAALGRPFFLPPEVPADRVAALRKAFAATMNDPDYIAEGNRVRLDMNPLSAERVTQLVNATVYAPPGIVANCDFNLVPTAGASGMTRSL